MTQPTAHIPSKPIAIIGMGCIFPESRNLKAFWSLLFNGKNAIKEVPAGSHWAAQAYFDPDPARPDHTYCTRGGFLPEIAFDPMIYGMPPKNIEATDTSQLLGLEVARMALADAGYPMGHPTLRDKTVNVILGVTGTQELVIPLGARLGHPLWKKALEDAQVAPEKRREILERMAGAYVQWQENSFPGLLGNVVAGRIANRLNLSGTNCVSDAACASSLSAIHTAVLELESGRCDMSISGGVDTLNDIFMHMCFAKTGVLSHSSDAKPFSKDADGTVLGEGVGMLVLKRLEDAQRDQDRIYAVIKGIGTSSDGRTSAVYAPEAKGQVRALKQAYDKAGITPASIELIEAHGTGTRVGDKVEFTALKQCYSHESGDKAPESDGKSGVGRTAIGSVKSMIGHTKAAAGAAGLIKTALALHHKVIPPTLKAKEPDPELNINGSGFYLNAASKPWTPGTGHPRRSGVSAFGFGGSNFHAVLEEYAPEKSHVSWDGSVQILAFSADTSDALAAQVLEFKHQLAPYTDSDQGDRTQAMASLAFDSRKAFAGDAPLRLLILVSEDQAPAPLLDAGLAAVRGEARAAAPIFFGSGSPKGKLAFLFPGQGSQYTGMAKDLIALFPEGMDALNLGRASLEQTDPKGDSLTNYIYPLPAHAMDPREAEDRLRQTRIAQPAIGTVSLAMTAIMNRFKVSPDFTCGHSFGELSALCAAGWISAEDFLHLAALRGSHMAAAGQKSKDAGSMLAVQAPIEAIEALIRDKGLDLVLANKNSQTQGVLSGRTQEIDRAKTLCREKKMRAVKLPVAAAFHSSLVREAAAPFKACVNEKPVKPTHINVLSNTTGGRYPRSEQEIQALLGDQLMHPVNFIQNIETMHESGVTTFVELGPKSVLTSLVHAILKDQEIQTLALDRSAGKKSGLQDLGHTLCAIAAAGFPMDLGQWEEPCDLPAIKKMKILITGANPKPHPPKVVPARTEPANEPCYVDRSPVKNLQPELVKGRPLPQANQTETRGNTMTPSPRVIPAVKAQPSQDAIHLVQKGLEAMQQLQEQTARAHEKFLETQAQASQTLAGMMDQTRGFLSGSPSVFSVSQPMAAPDMPAPCAPPAPVPAPEQTRPVRSTSQAGPGQYQHSAANGQQLQPSAEPVQPSENPSPAKVPGQTSEKAPEQENSVQSTLYKTVSRLTGFPEEMLEPEMDIESDLGIDSIKKVEIISELEKQLPQGQAISTEHLATVRTLADICKALKGAASPEPAPVAAAEPAAPAGQATPEPGGQGTMEALVAIISELTGFPAEMLEPDMNLESDLGIDSIKRVEILSKLEQALPGMDGLSPDELGNLKTIQNIVSMLTVSKEASKKKLQPMLNA